MPKRHILVIEDDDAIRMGVVDALKLHGFEVSEAADGDKGRSAALGCDCDLVLLDLVLPRRNGLDVLREVRASRPALPVIILTACGEESDRVKGLQLGADDYVVKPFSVQELLARVEAVLRRSAERPADVTQIDLPDGVADLARREVRLRGDRRNELSQLEADLLRYLACNAGRAVSRDELLQRVWRLEPRGLDTRTIDMTVARVREKLGEPTEPRVLLTVRGKGYMLAT